MFIVWLGYCIYNICKIYKIFNFQRYSYEEFSQEEFNILISAMILLCSLVIIFLGIHKNDIGEIIDTNIHSFPIASVRNRNEISGSFFIGTGNINSQDYYIYLRIFNDDSFKRDKILTDRSRIFENSNVNPKIEWTVVRRLHPPLLRKGIKMFDSYQKREGDYRIIVPENTIMHSFNINE